MPIKLNLDRVMAERQISLTDLADRIGITLANLSILKTNKARAIRFTTLEALCRELSCQPGELLEFVPGRAVPPQAAKGVKSDTETAGRPRLSASGHLGFLRDQQVYPRGVIAPMVPPSGVANFRRNARWARWE